jgi:hypothetical protein
MDWGQITHETTRQRQWEEWRQGGISWPGYGTSEFELSQR